MTALRPRLLAATIAALAAAGPTPQARASPVDCAAPERTLFACTTGSKKVAVCASAQLSATTGSVQYRFGRSDAVQLAYPPEGANWRAVTRGGVLMFSGGGGSFLAFSRRDHRYVVYTAIGRGWGSKAGVVVERRGKRIASLACRGEVTSVLGPELFAQAGIATTAEDFELP